jgi:hypothetical protein
MPAIFFLSIAKIAMFSEIAGKERRNLDLTKSIGNMQKKKISQFKKREKQTKNIAIHISFVLLSSKIVLCVYCEK